MCEFHVAHIVGVHAEDGGYGAKGQEDDGYDGECVYGCFLSVFVRIYAAKILCRRVSTRLSYYIDFEGEERKYYPILKISGTIIDIMEDFDTFLDERKAFSKEESLDPTRIIGRRLIFWWAWSSNPQINFVVFGVINWCFTHSISCMRLDKS